MIRHRLALLLFLILMGGGAVCQEQFIVQKDLQPEWLVYASQSYVPYNNFKDPVNTIYFSLNQKNNKSVYLQLKSSHDFSVMINGKLMLDQIKTTTLSIDSLGNLFSTANLFVAIHQENGISPNLITHICSKSFPDTTARDEGISLRSKTFFRDFTITALLILFIFLISMIRLNPRLSFDYFSVNKIFSLRDSDDDQFYYRLTSGNILFYVFTSLVLAFYLIIIDQFIETGSVSVNVHGYFGSLLVWLEISLIIFIFLFMKLIVIYMIASLFGVRDIAGFHFFNFIRLLLVFVGVFTLALVSYYILRGQRTGFYSFLYETLSWILAGWVILLFLKLTNRVQYSVFHIFSYICATEIIPFLLIIKVLNE